MMQPVPVHNERSLGELLSDLARETGTLVRNEVRLAKAEMNQKVARVGKDAVQVGAGGALAFAGLLFVLAAVALLLALVLPLWLSALIVGVVAAGGGYALVKRGLDQIKQIDPTPQQTVQTIKEDKLWLSEQVR